MVPNTCKYIILGLFLADTAASRRTRIINRLADAPWQWETGSGWKDYDEATCQQLSDAFNARHNTVRINTANGPYEVDFATMTQRSTSGRRGRDRNVRHNVEVEPSSHALVYQAPGGLVNQAPGGLVNRASGGLVNHAGASGNAATSLLLEFRKCSDGAGTHIAKSNKECLKRIAKILCGHETRWRNIEKVVEDRVSFPEFVEWASNLGVILPVGLSFRNLRAAFNYCMDEQAPATRPPTRSLTRFWERLKTRDNLSEERKLSDGTMRCFGVVATTVARGGLRLTSASVRQSMDADGNGAIDFSEFVAWASRFSDLPVGFGFDSLLQAFEHCDVDRSLLVDRQESKCLFMVTKDLGVHVDAGEVYDAIDTDKNGYINFPEFVDWIRIDHGKRNVAVGVEPEEPLVGGEVLPADPTFQLVQDMVDFTYRPTWTRDRHFNSIGLVPTRYVIKKVLRPANQKQWRKYWLKRAQVKYVWSEEQNWALPESNLNSMPPVRNGEVRTSETALSMQLGLDATIHEWLAFHGTSEDGAKGISSEDFKLSRAGNSTGSLYGGGVYLCDSVTKADEYCRGVGRRYMLVVRVVGGRTWYTADEDVDAKQIEDQIFKGHYHSVYGDREKAKQSYHELVVFDADQIFVEYILEYEAKYFEGDLPQALPAAFARCDPSNSGRVRFVLERLDREVRCLFDIGKLLKKDLLNGKRWPLPDRTPKDGHATVADIKDAWLVMDLDRSNTVTLREFQRWVDTE